MRITGLRKLEVVIVPAESQPGILQRFARRFQARAERPPPGVVRRPLIGRQMRHENMCHAQGARDRNHSVRRLLDHVQSDMAAGHGQFILRQGRLEPVEIVQRRIKRAIAFDLAIAQVCDHLQGLLQRPEVAGTVKLIGKRRHVLSSSDPAGTTPAPGLCRPGRAAVVRCGARPLHRTARQARRKCRSARYRPRAHATDH